MDRAPKSDRDSPKRLGTGMSLDPRDRWAQLKARVRIPHMLVARGLDSGFRVRRGRWVGPCPVHGGDNRTAFVVDIGRNLWHCFTRCGGGDSLKLAYLLCGESWPRVAHWLTELAGQPQPADPARRPPSITGAQPSPLSGSFRRFPRALPLDPTHPFFRRMHLAPPTLRIFEAGAWSGPGFLQGTVAVRLHDLEGQPLGYAGRRLDPVAIQRWGKWKWPPGYPRGQLLYSWHRAQRYLSQGLIVVEGPWSVMKLWQAGFPNAVALGGTGLASKQRDLLGQAARVVLFLDGDAAGQAATTRAAAALTDACVRAIRCPAEKDPADLAQTVLRDLVHAAAPQWTEVFPPPPAGGNTSPPG